MRLRCARFGSTTQSLPANLTSAAEHHPTPQHTSHYVAIMPSNQPLDEAKILKRFLIQPSSLPTLLSYKAFLNQLPSNIRNDASHERTLRKLYHDLQSQRNLDIASVRNNIAQECSNAGTIKARLHKAIAREMDGEIDEDEAMIIDMSRKSSSRQESRRSGSLELEMSRKRKRSMANAEDNDEDEAVEDDESNENKRVTRSASRRASSAAQSERSDDEEAASEHESESDDDENSENDVNDENQEEEEEIPESPTSSPPQSYRSTPEPERRDPTALDSILDNAFHGPRGLALPTSFTSNRPQSTFHSRSSLLNAMESAIVSLEAEIRELDREAVGIMEGMKETVGGLSDLRYGKLANDGLPWDIEEGLRGLIDVASGGR